MEMEKKMLNTETELEKRMKNEKSKLVNMGLSPMAMVRFAEMNRKLYNKSCKDCRKEWFKIVREGVGYPECLERLCTDCSALTIRLYNKFISKYGRSD